MGSLYISEYAGLEVARNGQTIQAGAEPSLATQKITTSGTSAQSAAFNAKTKFIRVHTDAIVSITFGADPTATTDHARMVAGQTEYFAVTAGQKLAAITNT